MKIKSHFTDYYDWIQSLGVDDSITYIRNIQYEPGLELLGRRSHTFVPEHVITETPRLSARTGLVCICEQYYPFVVVYTYTTKHLNSPNIHIEQFCYSQDELTTCLERYKDIYPNDYRRITCNFEIVKNTQVTGINDFCKSPIVVVQSFNFHPKTGLINTLCAKNNPMYSESGVYIDTCLANYRFQQVMSDKDVYQLISNYLRKQKFEPKTHEEPVTDKVKIVRAGFDLKTSFRKT